MLFPFLIVRPIEDLNLRVLIDSPNMTHAISSDVETGTVIGETVIRDLVGYDTDFSLGTEATATGFLN
jgi:hypothetical protein